MKRYGTEPAHSSKRMRTVGTTPARRPKYQQMEVARMVPVQNLNRTGGFIANKSENKYFDTVRAGFSPAVAGTIMNSSLLLITQGSAENNRIGNRIKITKVFLRGRYSSASTAAAADPDDIIRLIVYLDRQVNGATATVADVLETTDVFSFNNMANKGRFQIIADEKYSVNATAAFAAATVDSTYWFEINKTGLGINTTYGATTGAITDLRTNNIGVLAISLSAKGVIQYTARVRFEDV